LDLVLFFSFPVTYLNPTCSASFPDPTEQDFFFLTQSQLVAENKTPRENLSRSGGLNLEFASLQVEEISEDVRQATQIVARNQAIGKSLFRGMSRGVNSILNEMVAVYPFYNYIMIVEPDGNIFAVSTKDNTGRKIAGEQLLGRNFRKNPMCPKPSHLVTIGGSPGLDPYLKIIELESGLSQWFVSPVRKDGEFQGWVVLEFSVCRHILDQSEKFFPVFPTG